MLDRIIRSPDQIRALHCALSKKLKRRTGKEREAGSVFNKRRDWFRNFTSSGGERLEAKRVDILARITKNWSISVEQTKALLACSTLWASCPALFWHGSSPDESVIRNCYNDLERMCEVDPLRRRILLITLSDQIEQFQQALREESTVRPSVCIPKTSSKRERPLLISALRSMTTQLWPNANPESQEKIRNRIKYYSRAGWKWKQLAHTGILLSFQDSTVKR